MSCNYGAIASSINGELDNYNSILNQFKNTLDNLKSDWHSDAGTKLQGSLEDLNGEIGEEYSELQRFCSTLNDAQTCVKLDDEIATLQEKIDELGDCTESYTEKGITKTRVNQEKLAIKNSCIRYKNEKMDEKTILKQKISGALGGFGLSASEIESGGNFVLSGDLEARVSKMVNDYQANLYGVDGNGRGLITSKEKYYEVTGQTVEQLRGQIRKIQENYSGREAVLLTALALYEPLANTGYRFSYNHHGTDSRPFVQLEQFFETNSDGTGIDCNPTGSFLIDKGVPGGIVWRECNGFKKYGPEISREDFGTAQIGDVIVRNQNPSAGEAGHIMTIVGNHPEEGYFEVVEAKSPELGHQATKIPYSSLDLKHHVIDLTDLYAGNIPTSITHKEEDSKNIGINRENYGI